MKSFLSALTVVAAAISVSSAHYTFPALLVGSQNTGEWIHVRMTNNYWSNGPVTDVTSQDIRCYNTQVAYNATTINVAAGSTIGFTDDSSTGIQHPGPLQVYMAKAPSSVQGWDPTGAVWFKVYEIAPVTDGGSTITFPATGLKTIPFKLPSSLPAGEYLVRIEHIALHGASQFGGAQFYLSCAQINITGGGNGKPGPLVAFPGAYTGNEPGILLNIYYPVPKNYTMPGPALWQG